MSAKTSKTPIHELAKDRLSNGWGLAFITGHDWPTVVKVAQVNLEETRKANTLHGYRNTVVCRMEGATTEAHYPYNGFRWYKPNTGEFEKLQQLYKRPEMLARIDLTTEEDAAGDNSNWLIILRANNRKDCERWFDQYERRTAAPQEYDCTGQSFTVSWSFAPSPVRGVFAIRHTIGIDV